VNISKKLAVIAASSLAAITAAGGAFAYFTADGTGDGAATVGAASPWRIDNVATSGAPGGLLPGWGGQQAVGYRITNDSAGDQYLNSVVVTVKTEPNSTSVLGAPGCLASWFNVMTSFGGTDFAPLGNFDGSVSRTGRAVLGMNDGGGVNQDACQNKPIPVLISAS
jgi:hypothetical protein